MTGFQFFLILAVFIIAGLVVRFLRGERALALKRLFAIVGAVVAIAAILNPDTLTHVAHLVGIGRGTDLLLYLFILAMFAFIVATIRAKARADARVTELARSMALTEARLRERQEATEDH